LIYLVIFSPKSPLIWPSILIYNFIPLILVKTTGQDIQEQSRPNMSNPGADHFSFETVRFAPLTPADVGPNAEEDPITSTSEEDLSPVFLFPVPADNLLTIRDLDRKIDKVEILTLTGKVVFIQKIETATEEVILDISNLLDGTYFVQISGDKNYREVRKILVVE